MTSKLVGLGTAVALVVALVANAAKTSKSNTIVLTSSNTVVLSQEINGETVGAAILKLKQLDSSSLIGKSSKPIYMFMNTPGGSIQDGMELIDAVHGISRPVNTITLFAASMGFQIVQNLGDRLILPSGVLMSHRAKGAFEGEFGGQTPSQVDSRYKLWMDRLTELDMQTVKRTNGKQTLASYQAAYASEMWLTAGKALAGGYADQVTSVTCDSSLNGTSKHQAEFMGVPISYELSDCPIITGPMNVSAGMKTTQGTMSLDAFQKAGGGFGPYCLQGSDSKKLCALDTSVTPEKLKEVSTSFKSQYENDKNAVIPMKW